MGIPYDKKKYLGSVLKAQRKKDNKSLRCLAALCEMSYATLNDIENGNGFPTEKTILRIVKNLNFDDTAKIYDIYATVKGTAPPDVIEYLCENKAVVDEIRQRMKKDKGEIKS